MPKAKTTVTVDEQLLAEVDSLVANDTFESRSAAVEAALRELVASATQLAYDLALNALDPAEERSWAELGMNDYSALESASDPSDDNHPLGSANT